METLWYGEVINVNFDGTVHQTETINLIRDTKNRTIWLPVLYRQLDTGYE